MSIRYVYVYPIPYNNLDYGDETCQIQGESRLSGVVNKINKRNWLYLITLLSFNEAKTLEQGAEMNKSTSTE